MKAGEPNFVFRTLPGTKPVTRMELGGALGTVRDKIFVSTGSEVKGFTKKGKLFLQFETNLAEAIETMYISGSNLMVCGNYVYNHYNDCRVEFLNRKRNRQIEANVQEWFPLTVGDPLSCGDNLFVIKDP